MTNIKYSDSFKNLKNIDVYIQSSNNDYFQIYQLDEILPFGKSSFLIDIVDDVFVHDSSIIVEISNADNEVIYSEIPSFAEGHLRRVSIWTYLTDSEGPYTLSILGQLKNVPDEWKGAYNIRWQKQIYFQKALDNTQPIRFIQTPQVSVNESRKQHYKITYPDEQETKEISGERLSGFVISDYSSVNGVYKIHVDDNVLTSEMLDNGVIMTDNWTASLVSIIDDHYATVDKIYYEAEQLASTTNNNKQIATNFTDKSYTLSYIQNVSQSQATENYQSFARIAITSMSTFSGEVDRIKTYVKSRGDITATTYEYIGETEVVARDEYGFTLDEYTYDVQIPTWARNDNIDFKIEFYNAANVLAGSVNTYNDYFSGSNYYIEQDDNLLSGSIYVSSHTGAGLQLAGYNSGFIRSIGYNGYISASQYDSGSGFLMWTGSVLSDYTDEYDGVGLELFSNTESYFRFKTNPSLLEIATKDIFIGDLNGAYISASNGYLVISSSNFYLDSDGSLQLSGSVTASDGFIGGWKISPNSLNDGDQVYLDSDSASFYILDEFDKSLTNKIIDIGSGSLSNISTMGNNLLLYSDFESANWSDSWYTSSDVNWLQFNYKNDDTNYLLVDGNSNLNLLSGWQTGNIYLTQSIHNLVSDDIKEGQSLNLIFKAAYSSSLASTDYKWYSQTNIANIYYSIDGVTYSLLNNSNNNTFTINNNSNINLIYPLPSPSELGGEITDLRLEITSSYHVQTDYISGNEIKHTKFDDFYLYSDNPKVQLKQEGLLIFSNPYQYIKADKNGLDIKSGKISTQNLEVYGDVSVFGDFEASSIPPYDNVISEVDGNSSYAGSSTAYSRGDHRHLITFNTINTLLTVNDYTSSLNNNIIELFDSSSILNNNITELFDSSSILDNRINNNEITASALIDDFNYVQAVGTHNNVEFNNITSFNEISASATIFANELYSSNDIRAEGIVYATDGMFGGIYETQLKTDGIEGLPTGTVLIWKNGELQPCDKKADIMVMGVTKKGKNVPIVIGAEYILVTGKVDEGDFLITSNKKKGHAEAIKQNVLFKKNLFGKVIAQSLQSCDDSDSTLIFAMIRKM